MKKPEKVTCDLCKRQVPQEYSSKHHVVPKSLKGKETIMVCSPCGSQIHKLFTLREMQHTYNTVEKILSDSRMQRWVKWIRKTDHLKVCMKKKKKRH